MRPLMSHHRIAARNESSRVVSGSIYTDCDCVCAAGTASSKDCFITQHTKNDTRHVFEMTLKVAALIRHSHWAASFKKKFLSFFLNAT